VNEMHYFRLVCLC